MTSTKSTKAASAPVTTTAPAPDGVDLARALDHVAQGAIIVDAAAQVMFANRTARAIIAAGDGLAFGASGLFTPSAGETRKLRALIAAAVGVDTCGTLAIARGSLRPLWVVVAPLRAPSLPAGATPRAVLFVTDPERDAMLSAAQLRRLYGLTRAEAAVALLVARGAGLRAVTAALGVARATARTHLARVFQKTGTGRQAELVRLLLHSGVDPGAKSMEVGHGRHEDARRDLGTEDGPRKDAAPHARQACFVARPPIGSAVAADL